MSVTIEPATLTRGDAQALTDEVRSDVRSLWGKVLRLYEGGAHIALGYSSWEAYWEAEFGGSGSRGLQLVRAGRVMRVLEAADLNTLPANELTARELFPVLHRAPAELPAVWSQIIEAADGRPTARLVRDTVAPWRELPSPTRKKPPDQSMTERQTKKLRSLVRAPLVSARASATMADENLKNALTTHPEEPMMREWLDNAEHAHAALTKVIRTLRREIDVTP